MIAPLVARRKSFRRRNTSLARSTARERPAEGWSRAWAAKPSMGRSVSMNEDVSAGEEGPRARGGADLFLQFADRLRIAVFADDVDASLPPDRRFFRPQQEFDQGPRIRGPRGAARPSPPSNASHGHAKGLDADIKMRSHGTEGTRD